MFTGIDVARLLSKERRFRGTSNQSESESESESESLCASVASRPLVDAMTTRVQSGRAHWTVERCARKMMRSGFRHLPIVEAQSGQPIGVLALSDVGQVLAQWSSELHGPIYDWKRWDLRLEGPADRRRRKRGKGEGRENKDRAQKQKQKQKQKHRHGSGPKEGEVGGRVAGEASSADNCISDHLENQIQS